MSQEIITLLRELQRQGQFGLAVLMAALIILLAGGGWLLYLYRQQAALLKQSRDVNREDQRSTIELFKTQLDVLISTNGELRNELSRLSDRQSQFETDIKAAIDIGLRDIQTRLGQATVREILDSVPEAFRDELEREVRAAVTRSAKHLSTHFEQAFDFTSGNSQVSAKVKRAAEVISAQLLERLDDPIVASALAERLSRRLADQVDFPPYDRHYFYHRDFSDDARRRGLPYFMWYFLDDRWLRLLADVTRRA
jgi:hypothetical protein